MSRVYTFHHACRSHVDILRWPSLESLDFELTKPRIKLMVDAEHTWYQPALDAYTLLLSEKYNRPPKDGNWTGPLI